MYKKYTDDTNTNMHADPSVHMLMLDKVIIPSYHKLPPPLPNLPPSKSLITQTEQISKPPCPCLYLLVCIFASVLNWNYVNQNSPSPWLTWRIYLLFLYTPLFRASFLSKIFIFCETPWRGKFFKFIVFRFFTHVSQVKIYRRFFQSPPSCYRQRKITQGGYFFKGI